MNKFYDFLNVATTSRVLFYLEVRNKSIAFSLTQVFKKMLERELINFF